MGRGQSAGKTVLTLQGDPESSETIRQTSFVYAEKDEEMVRPAWRHAECGRNDCTFVTIVAEVTVANGPKVTTFIAALVKSG